MKYFFPTLSDDIIPETPQNNLVMEPQDVSSAMDSFIQEAYCDVDPDHMASQSILFDHVEDENPWKHLDEKWPGASKWAVDNPAPWTFCRLEFDKDKGFHWVDHLCRMKSKEYTAAMFLKECPKPTKRAKLVRKQNGMWQWRCPAQDEHFFNDPSPSTSAIEYLEICTGEHEVGVCQKPIDAWSTDDFYLDGDGFFIHKDCDKENGTDIRYVLLKNGKWDIVTKTRVPLINRRGKAVLRITVDAEKWLNLYPTAERRQYCTPKMLPV